MPSNTGGQESSGGQGDTPTREQLRQQETGGKGIKPGNTSGGQQAAGSNRTGEGMSRGSGDARMNDGRDEGRRGSQKIDNDELTEQVNSRLLYEGIDGDGLDISVHDGVVTIGGSQGSRDSLSRTLRSIRGVRDVKFVGSSPEGQRDRTHGSQREGMGGGSQGRSPDRPGDAGGSAAGGGQSGTTRGNRGQVERDDEPGRGPSGN